MRLVKKAKKGFTLIELVVVIAVIAILSAVSVVAYVGITNNAKKSAASQKASQMVTTIRAAVLASDKGYSSSFDDDENEATADKAYTITLDGKGLTFKVGTADASEEEIPLIVKDLLVEVGETDLAKESFKISTTVVNESTKESKLGVLVDGKQDNDDKNFQWVSF